MSIFVMCVTLHLPNDNTTGNDRYLSIMLSFGFLSTIVSFLQWRALLWSLSVYQYCTIRKHSFYLWFFLHASRVQKITSFDCTCLISHVPMCMHNHVGVFHTKKGRTAKRAALFQIRFRFLIKFLRKLVRLSEIIPDDIENCPLV